MKKLLLFLILFVITCSKINSQITAYQAGIVNQMRYNIYEILSPNQYIIDKKDDVSNYPWIAYLGLTLKERYLFTLTYEHVYYYTGFKFSQPRSEYGGHSVSVEQAHTIALQGSYYIFPSYSKFNIVPTLGFAFAKSSYYFGTFGIKRGWAQPNKDGTWTIEKCTSEWKTDYGNHKYYYFVRGDLKLTYSPFEFLTLFVQGGYNQGFKTIGDYIGWVQVADEPVINIKNRSKGSYTFLGVGLQIDFRINKDK